MCRIAVACPRIYPGDPNEWCRECRDEYERFLDQQGELAALALAHREFDAATPATDREWRERLDDVAPTVVELAITVFDQPPERMVTT